jgi:hypothetical protein
MPTGDFPYQFEESTDKEQPGFWLALHDFSGGVGTRWAREKRTDLKSLYGYWFGYLDTFHGLAHLPTLSTPDTPTDISALTTDYASMIEVYIGGAWRVVLVKGTKAWQTTGAAFGAATATVASAQGRQLFDAYTSKQGSAARALVWACGEGANVRFSTNGSTWAQLGATGQACDCVWNQTMYSQAMTRFALMAIQSSTGEVLHTFGFTNTAADNLISLPVELRFIPSYSDVGVIPLGYLDDAHSCYLLNGPTVWELNSTPDAPRWENIFPLPISGRAACRHEDEFAITDGSHIIFWHPTRPVQYIDIWGDDGVPSDMAGSVKALASVGPYLVATWQLDATPYTILFWGRQNLQGQWCWHPRSAPLFGQFPLSIGCPFVVARNTYTASRRLWTCTAHSIFGSSAYRQDYPKRSWNPLTDSTMQYEDGPLYLYDAWHDFILMGKRAGALQYLERNADVTSTETVAVAHRANYGATVEETYSWVNDAVFDDTMRSTDIQAGSGEQMFACQFRIGLDRGSTVTKTPLLRNLGGYCEPQERHPILDRT